MATLWDTVQPRSSRSNYEEAGQYAAATAKYLYDRVSPGQVHLGSLQHYNHGGNTFNDMFRGRHSGYGADDDSDSGSEGRRMRRRSGYGFRECTPMFGSGGIGGRR